MDLTGGCACAAIRYQISVAGGEVADYCHCRQCQLVSGAPVLAWVQLKPERFRLTRGVAKAYQSSADATRWFCETCGSQLYMTDAAAKSVGVTLATLDLPYIMPPTVHGWYSERIDWFTLADDLPRYLHSPPYDE
ncbi:MAG: GFA family protein [Acidocella sp.]|nr:GFA family protein [Acidocella sp.]